MKKTLLILSLLVFSAMGLYAQQSFPINNNLQVKAFPNPVQDRLTVEVAAGSDAKITVEVYDLVGKKIETQPVLWNSGKTWSFTFDLSGEKPGVYLIRVMEEGKEYPKVYRVNKNS